MRGKLRDGQDLTHDTTVRPLAAIVDLQTAQEIYANRIDLDDRSLPIHVDFSPYGNFAILTLGFSNRVEIRDVNRPTQVFSAIGDVGEFPRAAVLAPNGRLFVQGALSRNVLVYDMSTMLDDLRRVDAAAARRHPDRRQREAARADPRRKEDLSRRLGHADGRRGLHELRRVPLRRRSTTAASTTSARAAKGCGTRPRCSARGERTRPPELVRHARRGAGLRAPDPRPVRRTGFLPDDVFHVGTRDQPLGDPKAGLSADLDALAAYVTSLDHVNPSPYRNPDGSLTADGVAGKALFEKLGCDFCHGGPNSRTARAACCTTSARSRRSPACTRGARWSASTRRPCSACGRRRLTCTTARRRRCATSSPPETRATCTGTSARCRRSEVDQLVAYLQQIDSEPPVHRFPFDPPSTARTEGSRGRPGRADRGWLRVRDRGDRREAANQARRACSSSLGALAVVTRRRARAARGAGGGWRWRCS